MNVGLFDVAALDEETEQKPLHPDDLTPEQLSNGALLDGTCLCGCKEPATSDAADAALALLEGRTAIQELRAHRMRGQAARADIAHLINAWHRAELPLDAVAHGRALGLLGAPTQAWLNHWHYRAQIVMAGKPLLPRKGWWQDRKAWLQRALQRDTE